MKVTLNILKEDILNNDYTNSRVCPITRALERAGLKGYSDKGVGISNPEGKRVTVPFDPSYGSMFNKLLDMYRYKWSMWGEEREGIAPEDFTATIDISDESDTSAEPNLSDCQDFI